MRRERKAIVRRSGFKAEERENGMEKEMGVSITGVDECKEDGRTGEK